MDVSDILDMMQTFSGDAPNVDPQQREVFLRYLNVAYSEIYRDIAPLSKNIKLSEFHEETVNFTGDHPFFFNAIPLKVVDVFSSFNTKALRPIDRNDGIKLSLSNPNSTSPCDFYSWEVYDDDEYGIGFALRLYPFSNATRQEKLIVSYLKDFEPLYQSSSEEDIPFPRAYHHILVDGGLWYVFQEEGGFRDSLKAKESKERWERGKHHLYNFLANTR